MQFLDFTDAGFGLLVKRSAHQRQALGIPPDADDVFGIVVSKEFLEIDGQVICYPEIHWEGKVIACLCHPINAEPVRPHCLPIVTIEST